MDQRTKWQKIVDDLGEATFAQTDDAVLQVYQEALLDIKRKAKAYLAAYEQMTFAQRLEAERLLAVGEDIKTILNQANKKVTQAVLDGTAKQVENGYYGTLYAIEGAENINMPMSILGKDYIEQVVKSPVEGKTLSKRLYQNTQKLAKTTTRSLLQGAIDGKGYAYVAKRIADQTEADYKRALRIARTEGGRASSQATQKAYEDAKDAGIEMKKMWVATLDKKTRHSHQDLDGQTVGVDEDFISPATGAKGQGPRLMGRASEDINCRCTTIAVVDDIKPSLRLDNEDKKTIQNMTYKEWQNYKGVPQTPPKKTTPPPPAPVIEKKVKYSKTSQAYKAVKLNGIDEEYAKAIDGRLLDLQNTYPIAEGKIEITARPNKGAFGYNSSNIVGRKKGGQQVAQYNHNINFSTTHMNNFEASLRKHAATYRSRGSKLVDDLMGLSTVDHEYAHAIDTAYTLAVRSDLGALAAKYATPQPLTYSMINEINSFNTVLHSAPERLCEVVYNRMQSQYALSNVEFMAKVRSELGSYAIESRAEFLAEGFSNARNLANPSQFVKDFKAIFDEEYNKVIGGG